MIRRPRRKGLALMPALVCLVVVTLIVGVLLRQGAHQRKAVRKEERQAQADWLMESGLARGISQLSAEPDYQGETWSLPRGTLPEGPAEVRISVETIDQQPNKKRLRVVADYPSGDATEGRVRVSGALTVDRAPEISKGPS